jgi:tetratricopeptide (TPR) repeat protein
VLSALRRAAGAPVSFAELREAGVELPASVVCELELAGVAIERCSGEEHGAVCVRLDPASEPVLPMADPSEGRMAEKSGGRVLPLAGLVAAIALVALFVAIFASGSGRRAPVPIGKRTHPRLAVASGRAQPPVAHRSTHPSPQVPVSPALAADLEAQGHSLLQDGRYGDAIPVLKRAVLATGESVNACLEPASSTCLTYAYALYDLGRAERLSGKPQAAVPILERRLQIDNQRSTVVAELQLARQGIG